MDAKENEKTEVDFLLLTDDSDRINSALLYAKSLGLKIRKIQTERFMMSSILYVKEQGKWDIHIYNHLRHKGLAFPYIYLSLASILRREKIWFKTINPISFNDINKRIMKDYFTDKVMITGDEDFIEGFMQGMYFGFEIDFLLRNGKISNDEALKLFYDCDYMPEHAGLCAAIRRNGGHMQAKTISDFFWDNEKYDYLKTVERIDECIAKNKIEEKDIFYIQKTHFSELQKIDFDNKFDLFMKNSSSSLEFDLAISFAGENRIIAKQIAEGLKSRGYNIFYDEFEKSKMWGKDLYEYLSTIYKDKAKYCLIVISDDYVKKVWTRLERKSAQARAFLEENEYILPLRLDDAEVPGILSTTGYIDFRNETMDDIINLLVDKINLYGGK